MSKALNRLINKTTVRVIKNTAKLDLAVDDLVDKFKDSCPPKPELLKIVQQKNQLQSGLQNVVGVFSTLQTSAQVTETTVSAISAAVLIIKTIPIPTSFPPGFGIPINVITILADALDTLGDVLKGAKGSISVIPTVSRTITTAANDSISKLQVLDANLDRCIEELASGMNQNEKNNLINEIGNVAATSGDFSDAGLNLETEKELENQLSPNSTDPYLYQKTGFTTADWKLTIEYNANNEFSFPQRRIKAENINESTSNPYKGVVVYNIEGEKWSYSSSVKVLIEEAKYVIEQLNSSFNQYGNNDQFNGGVPTSLVGGGNTILSSTDGVSGNITADGFGTATSNLPPPGVEIPSKLQLLSLPKPENNQSNLKFGTIKTFKNNEKIKIIADVGEQPFQNNNNLFDFGIYGYGEFKLTVGIARSGQIGPPKLITLFPKREKKEKIINLPRKGNYIVTLFVTEQDDLRSANQPRVEIKPV